MILIYPPIAKPCEPPPGIAKLHAVLNRNGVRCRVVDASVEGVLALLENPSPNGTDRWTSRAVRNLDRNLTSLRGPAGYGNFDRYKRAVMDVNRALEQSAGDGRFRLSLSNYQDEKRSPVRSADLLRAAEAPEESPFYAYFQERLSGLIEEEQPSIVGISLNYLSQALPAFAMLGVLRRLCPSLVLVLGGGLVTSWMRRPGWRNPFGGVVDHLIPGPGEGPLLSLCGVQEPVSGHCAPRYDSLPLGLYLSPGPILPYSASSGCYWNKCAFCPERAEGNPYLPVAVSEALEDIHGLAGEMKPALIHLLDNALSPALLAALAKDPPGAPWYGFVRITSHLADLDFCMALRRAGCVMLKLGLESGDQTVIDREGKGIDLKVASRALKTLKKAGIATYVYLLFGTPSEGEAEARKTLDFTVKHSDAIDFLNLAIFNMPVYGPESRLVETKALYEGDLSLYTGFSHPGGWHRGLVRQFLDKEFKRRPAIAAILRNDPPFFTSNHAPFFV